MASDPPAARRPVREQGRALGDPTRYAIFEQLRQASNPVGVADLASAFGLHPNAVRLHLGTLREAGLVVEEQAAGSGRGRPPRQYRLSPGAIERWDSAGPHEELALMLLEMVQTRRSAREVGRSAGRRLAGSLSGPALDAIGTVVGVARRLGFEPTQPRLLDGDGPPGPRREVVLRRCPFTVGALRAPQVVCELHRGLAEGVLAESSASQDADVDRVEHVDLVVRDPRTAGCSLVFASATT